MFFSLLAAVIPALNPVSAIVTDIEGTTTSISFVHDKLFPYAKQNVHSYVAAHQHEPKVQSILKEVEQIGNVSPDQVASEMLKWMEQDKKITPLKTLQGMMWEDGYRQGAFQGHVYDDAFQQMTHWKMEGVPLYVYSSGSVQAQKLLFSYSDHGDMTPLFSNYFDTKIGGKKESASYNKIAEQIGVSAEQILFLSDSIDELNAARDAGMQTVHLDRDGLPFQDCGHARVTNFNEIVLP